MLIKQLLATVCLLTLSSTIGLAHTLPTQSMTEKTAASELLASTQGVKTSAYPRRIISLSPSTTELIYSLGVEDHLLAVSQYSNYPAAALNKPQIGDAFAVNVEQLINLQPDLILAWSSEPFSQHLRHLPQTQVWQSHPQRVQDLIQDIRQLATIVNSPKQAEVEQLQATLQALAQRYQRSQAISGLLLLSEQPLYVLTQESIQQDAIALCGAQNSFADIAQGAAVVSRESVLMRQPEFIVFTYSDEAERLSKQVFIRQSLGLTLEDKQMIGIDADTWSRPTMRFLQALPELCARIDSLRKHE